MGNVSKIISVLYFGKTKLLKQQILTKVYSLNYSDSLQDLKFYLKKKLRPTGNLCNFQYLLLEVRSFFKKKKKSAMLLP